VLKEIVGYFKTYSRKDLDMVVQAGGFHYMTHRSRGSRTKSLLPKAWTLFRVFLSFFCTDTNPKDKNYTCWDRWEFTGFNGIRFLKIKIYLPILSVIKVSFAVIKIFICQGFEISEKWNLYFYFTINTYNKSNKLLN
jgi:hypothetical protein